MLQGAKENLKVFLYKNSWTQHAFTSGTFSMRCEVEQTSVGPLFLNLLLECMCCFNPSKKKEKKRKKPDCLGLDLHKVHTKDYIWKECVMKHITIKKSLNTDATR